jgi:hypothetical protein
MAEPIVDARQPSGGSAISGGRLPVSPGLPIAGRMDRHSAELLESQYKSAPSTAEDFATEYWRRRPPFFSIRLG